MHTSKSSHGVSGNRGTSQQQHGLKKSKVLNKAPKSLRKMSKRVFHPHHNSIRSMALDANTSKYYSQSLALPTTPYPLRPEGGSLVMEQKVRGAISSSIYTEQLNPTRPSLPGEHPDVTNFKIAQRRKKIVSKRTRLPYRLHDGPPFANGDLHMGHFLNKTLKDVANRYKLARGYRVEFYPGWDCHGLPIELKALEATLGKSKKKGDSGKKDDKNGKKNKNATKTDTDKSNTTTPEQEAQDLAEKEQLAATNTAVNSTDPLPLEEIPGSWKCKITGSVLWGTNTPMQYHPQRRQLQLRDMASKFAQSAIMRQKQNMQEWSLLGDFNNPYITMDPTFEAAETLVLGNLVQKNSLYRQKMPVYWSPSSKTALAESELEYKDIISTAVYVCMPVVTHGGVFQQTPKPLLFKNKLQDDSQDDDDNTTTGQQQDDIEINPEALSLLIWTTTPWTLPANRAICVAPEGKYAHVKVTTSTSLVWDGHIYDVLQDKNVIIIESQVESLSSNWKGADGFNFDLFKQYLPTKASPIVEGETPIDTPKATPVPLPPGTRLVKRGIYDPEVHGAKAVSTKGKNKGAIVDVVLGRDVKSEVVQGDVDGSSLSSLQYISPLSLKLNSYLMTDAETCIDVDVENGQVGEFRAKNDNEENVAQNGQIASKRTKITLPTHKVIPAAHVLTDQGSGCVHTAPAHGEEDFQVGQEHKLPTACPVDEKGEYTADVGPELQGIAALEGGSKHVMKFLHNNGALLHREEYEHRYPHDWRTLKPVMLRATSQWFCRLDEAKETAKTALTDVFVTTDQARARLTSFIDSRDKWCISRQRYWGLPIPVFYSENGESTDQTGVLSNQDTTLHLSKLYSVLGTQAWWSLPSWRLLPTQFRGKVNKKYENIPLEQIVDSFLKENDIEMNNIDTASVTMAKNRHDYTSLETLNDEVESIDPVTGQKTTKKKQVTHIDGEAVVGLPADYYECEWKIGEDTVDVWLDSGSSWFSALYNKVSQSHLDGGYFNQENDQQGDHKMIESVQDSAETSSAVVHKKKSQQSLVDDEVNNLFGSLKKKQLAHNEEGENNEEFNPYTAIFGDLRSIRQKNHDKLIGEHQNDEFVDELSWQADLYLEGTDQHRGWFQSSLLLSSLLTGVSPFKALHSHGFVVDEEGKKMSKSLGNGVEPNSIIVDQGHGVDVLRCWASSVDCSRDAMMGKNTVQNTIDFVRKWRGIMRFSLGSLSTHQKLVGKKEFVENNEKASEATTTTTDKSDKKATKPVEVIPTEDEIMNAEWDFNPQTDLVPYNELHVLDKYILHHLHVTLQECEAGYQTYQMHKVINSIRHFMQGPLSSVYFDLSKDRLYANQSNHKDKKTALTTIYYIFSSLLKVMTPVLPHLTQEIFSYLPSRIQKGLVKGLSIQDGKETISDNDLNGLSTECVLNSGWVELKEEWSNPSTVENFDHIMTLRASVNQCIEIFRQQTNLLKEKEKLAQQQKKKEMEAKNQQQQEQQQPSGEGGEKKQQKQQKNPKKAAQEGETAEAPPAPTQQIIGDLASLPKVGSSNEVDVVITIHSASSQKKDNETSSQEQFADLLTTLNTDQFHELFMVASTTIQIDNTNGNNNNGENANQGNNTNVFAIKNQFDSHNPTSQRKLLETTTKVKLNNGETVHVTIGVAKSNGSKCPRCWRFSSPQDTLNQQIKNEKSAQKIEQNTIEMIYKSYIASNNTTIQQYTAELNQDSTHLSQHDDILCQRCDDFFTEQFGGEKLHL